MCKVYILTIGLLLISLQCIANVVNLSSKSKVYLLTCSSGEELYSVFGHSAIRVKDDSLKYDFVFNYGTFDFDTPNFYGKFMNGDLDYMLSYTFFNNFVGSYDRDGRGVNCSELNLTLDERQQLWALLIDNIKPENRFYRYDFFFDNCATRIRDIVFKVKGLNAEDFSKSSGYSYRHYLHVLAGEKSWKSQGVDLVLGIKADEMASFYQRAYIPQYLDSLFLQAKIISTSTPILSKKSSTSSSLLDVFTPTIFSLLLFFAVIILFTVELICKYYVYWFDVVLFTATLLVGMLLVYLGGFTKHTITEWNLNCLWASVFYLPTIILLTYKNRKIFHLRVIACVNCSILIVLILLNIFGVQSLPFMVYGISGALLLRNLSIIINAR